MTGSAPSTIVGCLLDVSASMREALETDGPDERATDRLSAVLRAALKLAQSELHHNPTASFFIGVFGLDTDNGYPPAIDLCEVARALLGPSGEHWSGHDLLIARANAEGVPHIKEYILKKLTESEARIVDAHLERHQEKIKDFVNAIPAEREIRKAKENAERAGEIGCSGAGFAISGPLGAIIGGFIGLALAALATDRGIENSEALRLARCMCKEWLKDFTNLTPQPVGEVVRLLDQLQERPEAEGDSANPTLLNTLRQYMYGRTPMRHALKRSLRTFKRHKDAERRVLILISDGLSSDGNPMTLARRLRKAKVDIVTVYLTSDPDAAQRSLYYQPVGNWHKGRRVLFNMAGRVAGVMHPVPVLASVGWRVPSDGEIALHATVSTSAALNEMCSLLLSARLGSANLLLDLVGRLRLDEYINDENVRGFQNPSDQGQEPTCYAHATAAVICMAMSRIFGRQGGYDDIEAVRQRILQAYPAGTNGWNARDVLENAATWYRLRVQEVDENAARQAVLRRRPVLATFRLSESGWRKFCCHFSRAKDEPTIPRPVLKQAQMAKHRCLPSAGGHAVVLVDCKPNCLTFLNSWGRDWGNNGSFSVESHTVLELDGPLEESPMLFYDVYWEETDLTAVERQAYHEEVDAGMSRLARQYPGILDLKLRCPHCQADTPLSGFATSGDSIRQVQCTKCNQIFTPEPGHLGN